MNGVEEPALRFTQATAHMLWVGILLWLVVFLMDRLWLRSPSARHGVHLLGMLAMLVAFPLCFLISDVPDPMSAEPAVAADRKGFNSIEADGPPTLGLGETVRYAGDGDRGVGAVVSSSEAPLHERTSSDFADRVESLVGWRKAGPWVSVAYGFGLIVMFVRLLFGWAGSGRLRKRADTVAVGLWWDSLESMRKRMHGRSEVALAWSREIATPVVMGLLKPAILLPVTLATRLSSAQVEAVLAHELAHLLRRDNWSLVVQRVVETLLFFHPAVWWMSRRMESLREEACDDLVLSSGCDPANYAEALVICSECRLEQNSVAARMAERLALTGKNGSPLQRRVMRLLGQSEQGGVRLGRAGWVLLAALGVSVTVVLGGTIRGEDNQPLPDEKDLELSVASTEGESGEDTNDAEGAAKVAGNLRLSVRREVPKDGKIPLRFRVRNVGAKAIDVLRPVSNGPGVGVLRVDEYGEQRGEAPFTLLDGAGLRQTIFTLKPGESHEWEGYALAVIPEIRRGSPLDKTLWAGTHRVRFELLAQTGKKADASDERLFLTTEEPIEVTLNQDLKIEDEPEVVRLIISRERGGRITAEGIMYSMNGEFVDAGRIEEWLGAKLKQSPDLVVQMFAEPDLKEQVERATLAARAAGLPPGRISKGDRPLGEQDITTPLDTARSWLRLIRDRKPEQAGRLVAPGRGEATREVNGMALKGLPTKLVESVKADQALVVGEGLTLTDAERPEGRERHLVIEFRPISRKRVHSMRIRESRFGWQIWRADVVDPKESANRVREFMDEKLTTNSVGMGPVPPFNGADPRETFLSVERFARLSAKEQRKGLVEFYGNLSPGTVNGFVEMILSSTPHDILNPGAEGDTYDGNSLLWAEQLENAASDLTAKAVADMLGGPTWLRVAARARALQMLRRYPELARDLVDADVDSKDKEEFSRGCAVIGGLMLKGYTDRLVKRWLAGDESSNAAHRTLLFLKDPKLEEDLISRVAEDPALLPRCAGLLQGLLNGKPADPVLLKFLDVNAPSYDRELAYHAASAMRYSEDPSLVETVARFAGNEEIRFREVAAEMIQRLPDEAFRGIRKNVLPLLKDKDDNVRAMALRRFSGRKDLAAGPVILEALKSVQTNEGFKVAVMQSMSALANQSWNYNMHEWGLGTKGNREAVQRFEAWLKEQGDSASAATPDSSDELFELRIAPLENGQVRGSLTKAREAGWFYSPGWPGERVRINGVEYRWATGRAFGSDLVRSLEDEFAYELFRKGRETLDGKPAPAWKPGVYRVQVGLGFVPDGEASPDKVRRVWSDTIEVTRIGGEGESPSRGNGWGSHDPEAGKAALAEMEEVRSDKFGLRFQLPASWETDPERRPQLPNELVYRGPKSFKKSGIPLADLTISVHETDSVEPVDVKSLEVGQSDQGAVTIAGVSAPVIGFKQPEDSLLSLSLKPYLFTQLSKDGRSYFLRMTFAPSERPADYVPLFKTICKSLEIFVGDPAAREPAELLLSPDEDGKVSVKMGGTEEGWNWYLGWDGDRVLIDGTVYQCTPAGFSGVTTLPEGAVGYDPFGRAWKTLDGEPAPEWEDGKYRVRVGLGFVKDADLGEVRRIWSDEIVVTRVR